MKAGACVIEKLTKNTENKNERKNERQGDKTI